MSIATEAPSLTRAAHSPSQFAISFPGDAASIASAWDALAEFGSGYQSHRFLLPWIAHVAEECGVVPRVGVMSDGQKPVAILPFGLVQRGRVRTAVYLGGRDSNLNGPLFAPWTSLDETDARQLLQYCASRMSPRPDLFVLTNQPRSLNGHRNPFVFADAIRSPSAAFQGPLPTNSDAMRAFGSPHARKKLRNKAARLADIGQLSYRREPPAEAAGALTTLAAQKQVRLGARGIDAGLTAPHMARFFAALANPDEGDPVLDVYVLRVGAEIAATFGGLPCGQHWHGLINSITDRPDIMRYSPGDVLLRHIMGDLADRGFTQFDLGIGEAHYKSAVCPETIELFDTIIPVTPLGHAVTAGKLLQLAAKRRIKATPWALSAARRVQALARRP